MLSNEDYQHIFHEIKNTVTLINSSLQLIQKQHPEVVSFNYWDDTLSDVNALKEVITDLSTARVCDTLHLQQVDITDFLYEVQHTTRVGFEGSVSCNFLMEDDLPMISIDPFRMKQALINLMKNAVEAIQGAGNLFIHTYVSDTLLIIDVTDSGCGISEENLHKIFTPFYTSKTGGSGLGLCITKTIIEAHGGQLVCHSTPGSGSTFSIQLPLPLLESK